ncbi:MAG TPA: dipeptide/oligopeptide/nickel ABC transporter ATP-binding protein [Candidatus Acidoferrum sp.]|nr:dipeptide/oligopeptide/nickel ABC transporter ATP-binding protein [Candidatus Acidoferrum sp.]
MLFRCENDQPLLRAENLEKRYKRADALDSKEEVAALSEVSFSIFPRTTLALVGESGSGKSTLALCLACLERPTSGNIWFGEREVTALNEKELRAIRPQIQLVFQDPASSLNPGWTALEIVSEPLLVQQRLGKQARRAKAHALLEQVGIPAEKASKRPGIFSGGQRQRLAIARALALEPKVLILDEALSALDCSVQAQIVNLLLELQTSLGLTYLFISHDFAMAAHLSDQIAVMHQGRIVETGSVETVVHAPKHTVTQRLITAAMGSPALPYPPKVA